VLKHRFKSTSLLIPRYIFGAMAPYIVLALLMLTAVLFAQQASRLAEVFI
jgi:lipopolysaccharide export LptBFGC system permease protein LptF